MPVLLFTSNNAASANIAQRLIERGFEKITEREWKYGNIRMIDTLVPNILDVPTNFDSDWLLVLSPHKAKSGIPMLTVHTPGNWDRADFGGEPRTLNNANGSKMAALLRALHMRNSSSGLNFEVVMEADHHGPTCDVPITFVEIGSTEKEWVNELAGDVVAHAVITALDSNEKYENTFGVGGGHYAKEFTHMVLNKKAIASHICPKYAVGSLAEDTFLQAIEKNVEKVRKVVLLKSLNVAQKEKVKGLCRQFGMCYEEL